MLLKDILAKLNSKKQKKTEAFLTLEISRGLVKSAVWTVKEEKTAVLNFGSTEEWEKESQGLIAAADLSLTKASEGIIPEPTRVIFGLPEGWVEGEEIKEEKKQLLKELSQKLELEPIGFVVNLEALVTFLRHKEGTPLSGIFIRLMETEVMITLVQTGRIKGSKMVGRSNDLAADVREGLARLGSFKELPSRMILFDGLADFEEARQQLISFDWQEHLPFLHFPQVEVLKINDSVEAVSIAGGAEVAKSLGFEIKEKEKEKEKAVQEEKTEKSQLTADELGFVQDKDVTEVETEIEEEEEKDRQLTVKSKEAVQLKKQPAVALQPQSAEPAKFKLKEKLARFFSIFSKASFKLPRLLVKKRPLFLVLPFIFILLVAGGGFLFYWYVPKAKVDIYLQAKVLEKDLSIIISQQADKVDQDQAVIPGSFKEIEVEGQETKETTGEKLIGDKAKGGVIVYNKTEMAKVFPQGTVLIGPGQLTFSLDEEIEVASKSAEQTDEGEKITYGKTETTLTAVSIGTEANLDPESDFSFKDYPTSLYEATAKDGLSGGTSRQVKAVSKEDQSQLLEQLNKRLKAEAKQKLEGQGSSQEKVIEKEVEEDVLQQDFSADVGQEEDQLTLKLKKKFIFPSFKKESLDQLVSQKISGEVPDGFVFKDQTFEVEIKEVEFEDDQAKAKVGVKLKLLPKLDLAEIKDNLKGRYPQVVEDYLEKLPNFSRADIQISPQLPAKLRTLPRLEDNITIEVKTEE